MGKPDPFFDREGDAMEVFAHEVEDLSECPEGSLGKMLHDLQDQTRKEHILEELITRPSADGSSDYPSYCKQYDSCAACIGKCDLYRG